MKYPIAQLSTSGSDLVNLAYKMRNLSGELDSVNVAISRCYGAGGVGSRAALVAGSVSGQAGRVQHLGEVAHTAAKLYVGAENQLAGKVYAADDELYVPKMIPDTPSVQEDSWDGLLKPGYLGKTVSTLLLPTSGFAGILYMLGKLQSADLPEASVALADGSWDTVFGKVNATIGKIDASVKSDFSVYKGKSGLEYKNDEWDSKDSETLVNAELGASVSVTGLEVNWNEEVGDDNLGLEGSVDIGIVNGELGAEGKFSISEDGKVSAYAKGEAIVSAVEGKAKSTVNILGLEIVLSASGYAGAVGVEGEIGIKEGRFVMKGGAAAGIGGSVGIEIGLNDTGWNNLEVGLEKAAQGVESVIDFITFWD